jgi:hypothetical protein
VTVAKAVRALAIARTTLQWPQEWRVAMQEAHRMISQLDEFKTRQRALWDSGEYSALSPFIADVGERGWTAPE